MKIKTVLKKVKFIFLDIVSFGSPHAIVFNLTVILLILLILPTTTLSSGPDISFYRNVIPHIVKNCPNTGLFANCDMPSYGLTRGVSRLLHGDLEGAINFNKGSPLLLLVMLTLIVVNLVKVVKEYKKVPFGH